MLEAARKAADAAGLPTLIAVTLLTSIDLAALADLPISGNPEDIARRLAVLAQECGLDGVVCSAADLAAIRGACGPGFLTVVPGIRPAGAEVQTRSASRRRRPRSPRAPTSSSSEGR